jgi:hypothetical protein
MERKMQEFWFCSACKSMNRGDATRCYKCRASKEQATLATIAEKPRDVAFTPGLDDDHRQIARALMSSHAYISAWRLGYLAAAFLFLFPILLLLMVGLGIAAIVTSQVDPDTTRLQVSPGLSSLFTAVTLAGGLDYLAMVLTHSAFLALTSMNTPALGSGSPRFGPIRSGLWWLECMVWQWWGLQVFLIPLYLVLGAGVLFTVLQTFGLILGAALAIFLIVIVKWAIESVGGPIASIGKPKRIHDDLLLRLGVPGASDARFAGLWGMSWAISRIIEFIVALSPMLLVALGFILLIAQGPLDIRMSGASADVAPTYAALLLAVPYLIHLGADLFGFYALSRITIQLSQRQRIREAWVRGAPGAADLRFAPATAARAYVAPAPAGSGPRPGGQPPMPRFAATQPGYMPQPGPAAQPGLPQEPGHGLPAAGSPQQPGMRLPTQTPAPSPVGAQPLLSIPTELPPDDMTPNWSRPVFSTKAPVEPPPVWTQTPAIPTSPNRPMPPAWSRAPQPFAPQSFVPTPPADDLPEAWRRAVQQSGPTPTSPAPVERQPAQPPAAPVALSGQDVAPADRPTIQPSAASLSRYRPSLPPAAPESVAPPPPAAPPPADDPSTDHDLGQGI